MFLQFFKYVGLEKLKYDKSMVTRRDSFVFFIKLSMDYEEYNSS